MTLPANVRVNTQVPFPATVQGSGPITLAKNLGRWIIGWAPQLLGIQNPPPFANFPTDYAVVYDAVNKVSILVPLSALATGGRLQRSITGAGNLPIQSSDSILNINNAADLIPVVPLAATRSGAPLTFKVLPGSHSQTITRTAPDTFDGANVLVVPAGGALTLVPYNDGVNAGYAIE